MKTKAISKIVFPAVAASVLSIGIVGTATAEDSAVQDVTASVAASMLYGAVNRDEYRWGKASEARVTDDSWQAERLRAPSDGAIASREQNPAAARSGYRWSDSSTSEGTAYKWGIRSNSDQAAYKWGIRSNSDQAAYKWGIRSNSDQAAYKWGIRSNSDQAAYKWGIRSNSDQAAYKWGIRSNSDQAAYKWGIR